MTAPNLLGSISVTGKTAYVATSSTTSDVLVNAASSNTVCKLNSVIITNGSASTITANVMVNRSSTLYFLVSGVSVPANATLVVLGKETSLYLEEGDTLQANTSATGSIFATASYELIE